jgi:hypothetical protein
MDEKNTRNISLMKNETLLINEAIFKCYPMEDILNENM